MSFNKKKRVGGVYFNDLPINSLWNSFDMKTKKKNYQ